MTMIDELWLPEGEHWDLNIEHHQLRNAGAFLGGNWKFIWHTTESDFTAYSAMKQLFIDRDAQGNLTQPQLLIGAKGKKIFVCQFIPLNRAGAALQHPSGTPETNRANCIQVEICGRAAGSGDWADRTYKALANLAVLVNHRRPISSNIPVAFSSDKRLSGGAFVPARGHLGHKHVPGNSHTDPGDGFKANLLIDLMRDAPHSL